MTLEQTRVPRIMWICDRAGEGGGVACSLYDLYPALLNTPCEIFFAAPKNARFPRLEALGAKVHKVLPRFPRARGYIWSLMSCFAILKLTLHLKPDIIVADHTNSLWLVLFLKAIRIPARSVYRNHGVEFLTNRPHLARAILRRIDHIVTVSEPEAGALKRLTRRPVTLVPNCLPAHCVPPLRSDRLDEESQGPTVAYVGWLSKEKGIFAFIDLIKEIRKDLPTVQGIAVGKILLERGSKDSEGDLVALMQGAGILFMGDTPRENIFMGVDFLAVCSRRESFGLTLVEAPFSDVIPVAYESPGTRFLLDECAECLVDNGNVERMKNRIVELWRAPQQRTEICRRLRTRFLREFDSNLLAGQLIAAFVGSK